MPLKLYKLLFKQSFQEFLIYRTTAISTIIFGLIFFFIELLTGYIYFDNSDTIYGWTRNDYLLLVSTATTITYLYQFLFVVAHENLSSKIIDGELDYVVLKPVNSLLYYVLNRVDFASCVNLLVSLIFQVRFLLNYQLTLPKILVHVIAILLGTYFLFIINQLIISVSFWKDRASKLFGIPEYLVEVSSRPGDIYPKSIRAIFNWLIPILLSINLPVLIIKGNGDYYPIFYLILVNITGTLFITYVWKKGMEKYNSSN